MHKSKAYIPGAGTVPGRVCIRLKTSNTQDDSKSRIRRATRAGGSESEGDGDESECDDVQQPGSDPSLGN